MAGPCARTSVSSEYHPWCWRNWVDFGTGLIGDLGCHMLSTPFKALKLGYPVSVEACSTKLNPETHPQGVMTRFEFPARGAHPPVVIHWYDGGLRPPRPPEFEDDRGWGYGVLYVGDKGKMLEHRLIPETSMRAFGKVPKTLPRSPGHYKEFVDACRGGPAPGSNFVDHAGLLSEVCMLSNVSVRAGKKILWDGVGMKVTNDNSATHFSIDPAGRGGVCEGLCSQGTAESKPVSICGQADFYSARNLIVDWKRGRPRPRSRSGSTMLTVSCIFGVKGEAPLLPEERKQTVCARMRFR